MHACTWTRAYKSVPSHPYHNTYLHTHTLSFVSRSVYKASDKHLFFPPSNACIIGWILWFWYFKRIYLWLKNVTAETLYWANLLIMKVMPWQLLKHYRFIVQNSRCYCRYTTTTLHLYTVFSCNIQGWIKSTTWALSSEVDLQSSVTSWLKPLKTTPMPLWSYRVFYKGTAKYWFIKKDSQGNYNPIKVLTWWLL